jgi:hypothetical protein
MLHIPNIEEIQKMLMQLPQLIQSFEKRDPTFASSVKNWLKCAEQVLTNNGLAIAAEISALRGVLISTERGLLPEGITFHGRITSRKIKDATAADLLKKADKIIIESIKGDITKFAEGEKLARQLVVLAERKGLLAIKSKSVGHTDMLRMIWQSINADPELGSAAAHLLSIAGINDVMILLDRAL